MDTGRNLLGEATSPYLLQHAGNPVHWRPWGAEALAEAKTPRLPDPALDRLRRLPLVPRDGARIVRERRHRQADERALRQREGRSRGAAGHRPHLHDGASRDGRAGRLADDHVPRSRRPADLRRHLLAARAALGPSLVPAGAGIGRRRLADAPAEDGGERGGAGGSPGKALGAEPGARAHARRPDQGRRRASRARSIRSTAASAARRNSPTRRSSASSGTRCSAAAIRNSARRSGPCSRR